MTPAEEEFLLAFANLTPVEEVVGEYRAYYSSDGKVTFYMANNFIDTDLKWINISQEEYRAQDHQWMWVVDGKLVKRLPTYDHYFPLTRSNKGVKVVKYHAGLVLESDETYEDVEYYTTRKNDN
jgi:hypothetical protein